jgi:hypothetical protein
MSRTSAIAVCSLLVLFLGGLAFQRCQFERKLATQTAQATKADTQLVTTTEQLGAEVVKEAKTQAAAKRSAVARHVEVEVAHETGGDADFADWLNERVGPADADAGARAGQR